MAGLRRVIEPNRSLRGPGRVLVSSGAGYVLHLVPGQPDAIAFEQDVGRARQLRKAGDPAGAVAALDSALSLWRGIAFAGVPGPFAGTERIRLGELRSTAAEERADVLLALGRQEEVVPDLTAMVTENPLRERMRGLLMIALYRCGRHAEALRVFQDGRRVLAEELGIDPGSDLSRIHQQVLTMDPVLATPDGPAEVTQMGWTGEVGGAAEGGPAPDGGQRRPRPEARLTPVPASCRSTRRASPAGAKSSASSGRCCLSPGEPASQRRSSPARRCRSWSSRAPRGRGRPRWPSGSATRWPGGSPAGSCTSTCGASTRPPRRWSQPRRCGSSSTPWASRRTGSRLAPRAGPPCSAACWTASGC